MSIFGEPEREGPRGVKPSGAFSLRGQDDRAEVLPEDVVSGLGVGSEHLEEPGDKVSTAAGVASSGLVG